MQKKRIWELDMLRGISILGMVIVHLFFDLTFFGNLELSLPDWFYFIKEYGYLFFVLISGICITFSETSYKRGVTVLGAAFLVSYVTLFAESFFGMDHIRIWFGILHMLGLSMLLYPLFRKMPPWLLFLFGAGFVGLGYWFKTFYIPVDFLFPLGLRSGNVYIGSDYFPMLPGFGWYLIGAFLGKTLYKRKESLFPKWNGEFFLIKFFRFCGRHSLMIYLAHQPILILFTMIITKIIG